MFPTAFRGSLEAIESTRQTIREQVPTMTTTEVERQSQYGASSFRRYPFMTSEDVERSAATIEALNTRFREMNAPCRIQPSNITAHQAAFTSHTRTPSPINKGLTWSSWQNFLGIQSEKANNIFGITATSNIKKGYVPSCTLDCMRLT